MGRRTEQTFALCGAVEVGLVGMREGGGRERGEESGGSRAEPTDCFAGWNLDNFLT